MGNTFKVTELRQIGNAVQWVVETVEKGLAGGTVLITLGREGRSIDQNARLWATLKDVSDQVSWYGQMLSPEDWKHVFSAALEKQKLVPGIDGGFVMCGISTSKMSKQKFSDLLEIINAFGAEQGVKWSDPSLEAFAEYMTDA
jgi:hypothetical protein